MHNTSCDVADCLVVTTTVVLVLLVAGLVARCMLGRMSKRQRQRHRGRSIVRHILFQVCFTLFLPFMSYVFSQTKSKPGVESKRRAEQVILWMLIVELLRKKVSAGIAPASENFTRGMGRYSLLYPVEEVVRMAWIGYLVYAYIHGGAIKPYFITLWIIGAATLCRRAICIHFAGDTFDLAMNARLISGYMAQLVNVRRQIGQGEDDCDHHNNHVHDVNIMTACNYAVMGESRLTRVLTPYGFEINDDVMGNIIDGDSDRVLYRSKMVRVSDIWNVAHRDPIFRYDDGMRHMLEDISLALALFKLLRRKVEGYYMAEAKTQEARHIMLRGLLALEGGMGEAADAERAFEVVELELRFLNEYYQDIIPMAVPAMLKLFVANFAWSIVFVTFYGITARHVTSNASIVIAVGSLLKGLVGIFIGMIVHHKCFLHQVASLVIMVRATFDIIITYLLMLTLIVVQTYQLVHYVLSDWFVMSLVCHYARRSRFVTVDLGRKIFCGILRMNHSSGAIIKVHQLNILKLQMLPWVWMLVSNLLKRRLIGLPDAIVTTDAKVAVVRALKDVLTYSGDEHYRFTNGRAALNRQGFRHLDWACDGYTGGVATVIMVWHLATALLAARDRQRHPLPIYGQAALVLSRYCAYLVAYEPGLLPDDEAWTKKVYKDMVTKLNRLSRSCSSTVDRHEGLMNFFPAREEEVSVIAEGVKLARQLMDRDLLEEDGRVDGSMRLDEMIWGMLLEFWAELLVFVARRPTAGPEAHARALANGGEFITHIWTMLIHAGIQVHKSHREEQACHRA